MSEPSAPDSSPQLCCRCKVPMVLGHAYRDWTVIYDAEDGVMDVREPTVEHSVGLTLCAGCSNALLDFLAGETVAEPADPTDCLPVGNS